MTQRRSAVLAAVILLETLLATAALAESAPFGPAVPLVPVSASHTFVRCFHRRPHYATVARVGSPEAKPLPSRSMSTGPGSASLVGRLATVISDNAPIHAGRDRYNRLLSVCTKGQNLAICGETDTEYAVVMIDRSIGFIAKKDAQLLDYQVVNTAPDSTSTVTPPAVEAIPTQPPATSADTLGQQLVRTATGYLGVPYVWGGNTRDGIDCSGFVKAVYAAGGMILPRHSGDQAAIGYDVPKSDWTQWVPGDRMYFACHHPEIDHTGMYIGNGYFIHASVGHNHQVAIDRVDNEYYFQHLVAVRRSAELLGEAPSGITLQPASSLPPTLPSTPINTGPDPEASQAGDQTTNSNSSSIPISAQTDDSESSQQ